MYSDFSQTFPVGFSSQFNAQYSLLSGLTKQWLHGAMKINALNMQAASALFEESMASSRQFLTSPQSAKSLPLWVAEAQPAVEKIRSYQQHVRNILAETQTGMAKTVEVYMPQAIRMNETMLRETVQKVADESIKGPWNQPL